MTTQPAIHVCFGTPGIHLDEIEKLARKGKTGNWTINSAAVRGDRVVFYMIRPLSSFVALGHVSNEPKKGMEAAWANEYMAKIDDIRILPAHVQLRDVKKELLDDWPWLIQPRRSTVVPSKIAGRFLSLLENLAVESLFASESDIEGTKTEVLQLRTKR